MRPRRTLGDPHDGVRTGSVCKPRWPGPQGGEWPSTTPVGGSVFGDYTVHMGRAIVILISLTSATLVALLTAALAQELEIPLSAVRSDALAAAGLIFAAAGRRSHRKLHP
jgi:hypothetical protein